MVQRNILAILKHSKYDPIRKRYKIILFISAHLVFTTIFFTLLFKNPQPPITYTLSHLFIIGIVTFFAFLYRQFLTLITQFKAKEKRFRQIYSISFFVLTLLGHHFFNQIIILQVPFWTIAILLVVLTSVYLILLKKVTNLYRPF